MENRNWKDLEKQDPKPPTISSGAKPSSGSPDQQFLVSFGAVISCCLGDVERIRESIHALGGRIVFQTVSNGPLFLLRAGQVERALQGDLSALAEIHIKKTRRSEKI
jgi:hypothetical protein